MFALMVLRSYSMAYLLCSMPRIACCVRQCSSSVYSLRIFRINLGTIVFDDKIGELDDCYVNYAKRYHSLAEIFNSCRPDNIPLTVLPEVLNYSLFNNLKWLSPYIMGLIKKKIVFINVELIKTASLKQNAFREAVLVFLILNPQ